MTSLSTACPSAPYLHENGVAGIAVLQRFPFRLAPREAGLYATCEAAVNRFARPPGVRLYHAQR